jgi:pyroglutamyl-peptidase
MADGSLLVTGFEPFDKHILNPSGRIAQQLDGEMLAGRRVAGVVLPVTRDGGPRALSEAIERQRPEIVLCLGLAEGRAVLSAERVAINVLDYPVADNAGEQPVDAPVIPGGPAAYFATLPVKAILSAWREAGVPGAVSNTAGTFLCNQIMYAALHLGATLGFRAGFIHTPFLPEQAAAARTPTASMSLEVMVQGVRLALETSLTRQADLRVEAGAIS